MVGLAASDFVVSVACVLLFVIPVLEFTSQSTSRTWGCLRRPAISPKKGQNGIAVTENQTIRTLTQTANRNVTWAIVACGSTTFYLVLASPLAREYHTLWNTLGMVDMCINVWSLRMMFGQPAFMRSRLCQAFGRTCARVPEMADATLTMSRQRMNIAPNPAPMEAPEPTIDYGTQIVCEEDADRALGFAKVKG
jgi:hypothetical protein